jgi:hypothetical protein
VKAKTATPLKNAALASGERPALQSASRFGKKHFLFSRIYFSKGHQAGLQT